LNLFEEVRLEVE